jgi:leucine dehydrogenase
LTIVNVCDYPLAMQETHYSIFDQLSKRDHEQVVFCRDEPSGLKAIIGIHNTVLGPALGGCRMYPYASERDAFIDVLRLSRGMTYKASIAGLNLGGGKAVVIGDPKKQKSETLWRAFGRFIEGLNGRYVTAEDVGTSTRDMEYVRMETHYVTGTSHSLGGSGDPSPVTALGAFHGMRAAMQEKYGHEEFSKIKVAVQGCGHVGYNLVKHLVQAGAKVTIADVDVEAVKNTMQDFGVQAVTPSEIYDVGCDIFAPCAMGGIINDQTIPRLKCSIIAGAANNQLADEKIDGARLLEHDILYAPDFVVNAGGLISVGNELQYYNQEATLMQAAGIYDILKNVFSRMRRQMLWR